MAGERGVSATLVQALAAAPPAEDPVVFTCDGEHLRFGALKVACKWQPVSSMVLAAPRQPEWIEALALKYTLPRARIIARYFEACADGARAARTSYADEKVLL